MWHRLFSSSRVVGVVLAAVVAGAMTATPTAFAAAALPVVSTPSAAGAVVPVTATRIADSRSRLPIPGPVPGQGTVGVQVTGRGGIPSNGVAAAVLTVTVVWPWAPGFLTVWPSGTPRPGTSNLIFQVGQSIANTVIVPVGADGRIQLFNGSFGYVQLIVDVTGYTLARDTDITPPGPVTAPTVTQATTTSLALHWVNPADADLTGVMIRRAQGSIAPPSPTAGVLVADVPTPQAAITDTGLTAGTTYSYALYAHDRAGNDAPAATVTGVTASSGLRIDPLAAIDAGGSTVDLAGRQHIVTPAGPGTASCPAGTAIAMAGALYTTVGMNVLHGARLAIDQFNQANPGCQLTLKPFDTAGDPQTAAAQIVGDASIIGLLGPAFSGETTATGAVFNQAALLSATASATSPALTGNGWTNFFRGLGNDQLQAVATAKWLTGQQGYQKVCVVHDSTGYVAGLASSVTQALGPAAASTCAATVQTGARDFSATIRSIKSVNPDAVYYAGFWTEAAPFVQQLRAAGVTARFVSGDGSNDPQFVAQAGPASQGTILTGLFGPATDEFAVHYQTAFGAAPGAYSVDAYDIATIMVTGISSGVTDRAGMIGYFRTYDGQGLAKNYRWDASGELTDPILWLYQVQ